MMSGYILLKKVSSHDLQNLCTSFVTSVQYEELLFILPLIRLFFLIKNLFFFIICIRSFLQETQLLSLHIDEIHLSFQRNHLILS